MTAAGFSRSSPTGSRSGWLHSPSRRSVPTASPTRRHNSEASRALRGRSSSPTSEAKACSAAPPVARRRSHISRSLSALGSRSPTAVATTTSTQPSTSASSVSSRPSAASLTLVTLGPIAPAPPESNSWSLAGSCRMDGSSPEARSSSPEVSTRMPRAYSSTVARNRARSQGAPENSRRCAASRAARKTTTSCRGSSSSSANSSIAAGLSAATPSSPNGIPTSEENSTAGASLPSPCPSCMPKPMPPIWSSMPSSGPASWRASSGMAPLVAEFICSATGVQIFSQVGRECSTHCWGVHTSVRCTPEGNWVVSSSHSSARRTDSCAAVREASVITGVRPRDWRATVRASW